MITQNCLTLIKVVLKGYERYTKQGRYNAFG